MKTPYPRLISAPETPFEFLFTLFGFFLLTSSPNFKKGALLDSLKVRQKLEKITFSHKTDKKWVKNPLFTNFWLTYIDVFFDEESESDVIF